MDTSTIDTATVADLFLLLLIGIGPKIALVPFLELTADLDAGAKRRVVRTMVTTVAVVALILWSCSASSCGGCCTSRRGPSASPAGSCS